MAEKGHYKAKPGSDRSFGLVIAGAFLMLTLAPLLKGASPRLWAGGLALAFAVVAMVAPRWLAPLNRVWFKLGLALGMVVGPVAMMLLFFIAITPMGIAMRCFGYDPLQTRRRHSTSSYWIERKQPMESMKYQF